MCGILGQRSRDRSPVPGASIVAGLRALRHRGPDDEGYVLVDTASGRTSARGGADTPDAVFAFDAPYAPAAGPADEAAGDLALAARRLAIQDLSPAGHQPLCNEDGTVWVVHNGEIHNFVELRQELSARGHRFRSHGDTEVIVHAYEEWGEDCFHRFNGMWALALWDARRRLLLCSRDRYGIKPLVYTEANGAFSFASEIKGLLALGAVHAEVNELLAYDYLAHGFVDHTSETFFRGVLTLPPGHLARVRDDARAEVVRWYDLPLSTAGAEGASERFEELFVDATGLRLTSDVPVGTCLSGGLDSSSIVSVVAELTRSGRASLGGAAVQKTFTARYPGAPRIDEGPFAAEVAARSGAEQHEVFPTGQSLLTDLERLIWHQEEPFGSTSIYAQWCVYRLARSEGVPVTLDGQGGDEVVGGYPQQLSPFLTQLLRSGRVRDWARELRAAHGIEGTQAALAFVTTALRGVLWSAPAPLQRALQTTRARRRYPDWLNRRGEVAPRYAAALSSTRPGDKFTAQMLSDLTFGLPALLRYCDRNSMAHSVEARLPFLDHRLVELCFSLPPEARIHNGRTKAILREALADRIPASVLARRDKIGFATPEAAWLRTDLRGLITEVVTSRSFAERGYVKPERVSALALSHDEGDRRTAGALWRCVNLELWLRRFIDASAARALPATPLLHA